MTLSRTEKETLLLVAGALLALVAWFGPPLADPAWAHDFADRRTLLGLPHALDVLSNLPFAVLGLLGFGALRRVPVLPAAQRAAARLFFAGLVLTAVTSSVYHLAPAETGLALDRLGMSVAFAGLLALVAATTVSERAGRLLAGALLVAGPASVLAWFLTGNVLPWGVVQFGGIALVLVMLAAGRTSGGLPVRWGLVLLAYGVAKLFEVADHIVFEASRQLFSGHTLKHVVAAAAAWPVIAGLRAAGCRHNQPKTAAQAAA